MQVLNNHLKVEVTHSVSQILNININRYLSQLGKTMYINFAPIYP